MPAHRTSAPGAACAGDDDHLVAQGEQALAQHVPAAAYVTGLLHCVAMRLRSMCHRRNMCHSTASASPQHTVAMRLRSIRLPCPRPHPAPPGPAKLHHGGPVTYGPASLCTPPHAARRKAKRPTRTLVRPSRPAHRRDAPAPTADGRRARYAGGGASPARALSVLLAGSWALSRSRVRSHAAPVAWPDTRFLHSSIS